MVDGRGGRGPKGPGGATRAAPAARSPGRSAPVASAQTGPHPHLDEIVLRHLGAPWRRPLAAHALEALARLEAFVGAGPWWLDAGCGTGESTARLALSAPGSIRVVGVDKSAARLARGPEFVPGGRILLLRTDVADLWRLLAQRGLQPQRHFVLYPNPWPKAAHVRRRWQGHPVWPDLMRVGGVLELRTNWRIYAEEWVRAATLAGRAPVLESLAPPAPDEALTPHERKYAASGHTLWRVRCGAPQT